MLSANVYADTLLSADTESRTVTVSGNAESDRVKSFISFAVIPYGENTSENVFYKTIQTGNDGNFKTEFSLPDKMPNGQYSVISYDASGKNINRLGLINDDFLPDLQRINSAASAAETENILKSLTSYTIDEETLADFGKSISLYLYNIRPVSGYTKESFVKTYNMGEALARAASGDISLGDLLREYSAYTDADYTNTYEKLSETGKTEADALFKKEISSISGNFAQVYMRIFEIAEIKGSKTAKELETSYLYSASQRNRSLADYNSLSSYKKESVFLLMFSSIGSKNSLSEIDALFDECVRKQKTPDKTAGGGGGGGNSSGANRGTSSPVSNSVPAVMPDKNDGLSDIRGHWAENDIKNLYEKGVINGFDDGKFCPDNAVTRAEFVKIMCRMFDLNGKGDCSFKDVSSSDWFYDAVCTAEKYGLAEGSDGKFYPHKPITREDAAVILQRFLKTEITEDITFADSEKVSDYAVKAIQALAGKGIIKGYDDNTINPKGEITRAETAVIIQRAAMQK